MLIRSANDSAEDVAAYSERAHGFLSKAPIESDRKVIKRAFFKRFGVNRTPVTEEPSSGNLSPAETNLIAASRELRKAVRLVDSSGDTRMGWGEMWKWLHRIKGIVATIKGALQAEQPPLTLALTLTLTNLSPLTPSPAGGAARSSHQRHRDDRADAPQAHGECRRQQQRPQGA